MNQMREPDNHIVVFYDNKIRRAFHKDEWWFSIIDVVSILSGSKNPRRYWSDLKHQLFEKEEFIQLYEKIVQLKLTSSDEKKYNTDCANTHMNDLELIFTMLGEASTTEIARKEDAKGFKKNCEAACSGGEVAGNARKDLEAPLCCVKCCRFASTFNRARAKFA